MYHQYYCERPPIHVALAKHRVEVVMDKGATSALHLCEQCYNYIRARMVIKWEMPVLSIADWERILEKNYLAREWINDLQILTMHEIGTRKRRVLGVKVADAYWLLYLDFELLARLDRIRNDEEMQQWSDDIAVLWGATLGLAT